MRRTVLLASLFIALPALADSLSGTLSDPGLRRRVELVYIEKAPGTFKPPATPAVVNQRHNTYLPKLLPVVVGTKVSFTSEDAELHNVFARGGSKTLFNQAQLPKQIFEKSFNTLGPVHLTCNIHKEMSAWVLVLQNPFFAKPDPKTGEFLINGVPPGKYTLRIWGEKLDEEELEKSIPVTVGKGSQPLVVSAR
jgi:plastocyanin